MTDQIKFTSGEEWSFEKIDHVYCLIEDIAHEKYNLDFYSNQIEMIGSEQMLDAYCITPNHKLLREDLRWIEADKIVVGDAVLGFDEEGPHRKYKKAIVTNKEYDQKEVFEVKLSSGKIFKVTGNHLWLVRAKKGKTSLLKWKSTRELKSLQCNAKYPTYIPKVCDMWEQNCSYDAGWLSGIFDGEGTTLRNTLQMKTPVCEEVVSVKMVGVQTIVKISTTTNTFVCDGYPMHNSAVGMPTYYSHWSFGKQYVKESELYRRGDMGLAYEIVINSNPCISYLMEENTMGMQALVIAHACIGHNSFFKHNIHFKQWTDADAIIDYLVFAKNFIAECEEKYGAKAVEETLDSAHALRLNGLDRYKRPASLTHTKQKDRQRARDAHDHERMNDIWRTLPEVDSVTKEIKEKFPREPEDNVLYFIEKHAPNLDLWKREILRIVRKVAQYFYPQMLTKVMNEGWACVTGDTLIDTPNGLLRADSIVTSRYNGFVDDGITDQRIVHWFEGQQKKRVRVKLKNGFVLHGGLDHKILVNNKWIELQDIKVGNVLPVVRGRNQWAQQYVKLPNHERHTKLTLDDTCKEFDVHIKTYYKWLNGTGFVSENKAATCEKIAAYYQSNSNKQTHKNTNTRINVDFPSCLTEQYAYWLGLIVGDGGIYNGKYKKVYYVTEDVELRDWFVRTTKDLFDLNASVKSDRNHWVISVYSYDLVTYLTDVFNLPTGKAADRKVVPKQVLTSPGSVVAAFLRGHFDTDGCADKSSGNVILISKSEDLIRVEQQLLLKTGIVCSVSRQVDDCYRLTITGSDAVLFRERIGFGLNRKQKTLEHSLSERKWFKQKNDTSKVVEVTFDEGIVYDFSVENTHQYKASCFINHNCFWHYTIMYDLYDRGHVTDGLMLEFLTSHTNVVKQKQFESINPYALGFAMFQDIKRISMEPTAEDREWFDWAGNGDWLSTIKYAAYNFKDESFILQYLSPKVMRDFGMFYVLDDDENPSMVVEAIQNDEGYRQVRAKLAEQQNVNNSLPYIQVTNVNVWGDRSIELHHHTTQRHTLNEGDAIKTLYHLSQLWGYSCRLITVTSTGKATDIYEYDPTFVDIELI
jgi:stage V sporulation protein R